MHWRVQYLKEFKQNKKFLQKVYSLEMLEMLVLQFARHDSDLCRVFFLGEFCIRNRIFWT